MHPLLWLLTLMGGNVVFGTIYHEIEKTVVAAEAHRYAKKRLKPMLDFGCGNRPRGDVNVDVVPRQAKNFILIQRFNLPRLPFRGKYFASALAFHVLEHTENPQHTLKELQRVAEKLFIVTPKPIWLLTWLNPDHRWIFFTNEVYVKNPLYHTKEDMNKIAILYPEG